MVRGIEVDRESFCIGWAIAFPEIACYALAAGLRARGGLFFLGKNA